MVGVVRDDHALVPAHDAGDADREVVGLGAGAHEVADAKILRHRGRQPLRVAHDVVVQVARVRVEGRRLPRKRRHHVRVAVTDRGHVVVAIEVTAPVRVIDPGALAAHQVHGTVIEQAIARPQRAVATLAQPGDVDVLRQQAHAPAGRAIALMHLRAIEGEESRQRAHDVGPLLGEPGGRLLECVNAKVVQAERGREPQQREVVQDLELVVHQRQDGVPGLHLRHGIVQ